MLGLSLKSLGRCAAAFVIFSAAAAQAGVVISSKPTKNMSCSAGTCSATAKDAVLNAGDLTTMLASGDVTLTSGSVAQDIAVDAALTWTSTSRLTLDSYHAIAFDKPVVVAGTGALTITVNDGGSGGDFTFSDKGHVEFWDTNSSLIINGTPYTLLHAHELQHATRANPAGFYALARDYNAKKDGTYTRRAFILDLTGAIEGLGNTISNFAMSSRRSEIAFCSNNHGTIRDLKLADANVTGLAGTGYMMVAALVGQNFGTIRNSAASGQVLVQARGSYVGGLVGYNEGTISGSHASVTVNGSLDDVTGGLLGVSYYQGKISTSFATGAVVGGTGHTGGFIGYNQGNSISQSYATGSVSGAGIAGGFVGRNSGLVSDVYASGSVSGQTAGGAVGDLEGDIILISNAYSTGAVSGIINQGGFAGRDPADEIATSYWDLDTSGISDPSQGAGVPQNDPGIAGLSDVQLKSGLPSGFDPAIWGQSPTINNGYPYLLAVPPG